MGTLKSMSCVLLTMVLLPIAALVAVVRVLWRRFRGKATQSSTPITVVTLSLGGPRGVMEHLHSEVRRN